MSEKMTNTLEKSLESLVLEPAMEKPSERLLMAVQQIWNCLRKTYKLN